MRAAYSGIFAPEGLYNGTILLKEIGAAGDLLTPGQIVEAKVIFASDEYANVKLNNGAMLRAKLSGGVTLAEGETVFLCVRSSDGESLVLQLVPRAGGHNALLSALAGAGLPPEPQNLNLAAAFISAGLPVEEEALRRAAELLVTFPSINTETAVFAAANRLRVDADNIIIINSLLKSELKADEIINRALSSMYGGALALRNAPNGTEVNINYLQPVFELLTRAGEQAAAYQAEQVDINNKPDLSQYTFDKGGSAPEAELPEQSSGRGINVTSPDEGETIMRNADRLEARGPDMPTDGGGQDGRLRFLKAAEEAFFARIEKPQDSAKLKETAENLLGRLEALKTLAERSLNKSSAGEIRKLISGLRLMESAAEYSYMQIPVILSNRASTAELYVFRRKKRDLKTKRGRTALVLSLDTIKLGRVVAVVNIIENNISVRFNVEDKEIADYLRSRTTALYNIVYISGYRLSGASFQAGTEAVTMLNAQKLSVHDGINVCV